MKKITSKFKDRGSQPAFASEDLSAPLAAGLAALGLDVPGAQQAQLLRYLELLAKWNQVYNLTAVTAPRAMVVQHLLDSLAVVPFLTGERIIDVGTGAGLPGLPLAIVCPGKSFVLLDSQQKKMRFVTQAVLELGLKNVTVVSRRAEDYQPETGFDVVISRAFAAISDMLRIAGHLCHPDGVLLAMKGQYPTAELAALPPGYHLEAVQHLTVPGLNKERHAVIIRKE